MPRSSGSDDEPPTLGRLPVDGLAGAPPGAGELAMLPGVEGTLTEGPPEPPELVDGLADGLLGTGVLAMLPDGAVGAPGLGAPTPGDGVGELMLPGEALGAAVLVAASACRLQRSTSACVGDVVCA
jgi:hypothetical protein